MVETCGGVGVGAVVVLRMDAVAGQGYAINHGRGRANNQGKAINQGTYRQRRRQPARYFGSSCRGRRVRCVSGRNLLRVVTVLISLATDETKRQCKARQL